MIYLTILFHPQFFQHIFALVQFGVGKYNGNSFTFIQYKIIAPAHCHFLYCIVHFILDGLDQFLAFFEQISLKTKAFALEVPEVFFLSKQLIFPFFTEIFCTALYTLSCIGLISS